MRSFFMIKLAVCTIIKDDSEVENLEKSLASYIDHVDKVFITGTKEPQDKIKKLCKKIGAKHSFYKWDKSFANARNFNFSQVPKEYNWIFWCDTDDEVVGAENLRHECEIADQNNIKAVFCRYLYQCEFNPDGSIKNILIEHLRERLIKNDNSMEWVAPIHETLIEKAPIGKSDCQTFMVVHHATLKSMESSIWRNIDILEEEVMHNPQDPRPIYYLAKAYFDTKIQEILYEPAGEGSDSITLELLKDYQRKSGWAEERAQCWEYMSMIHRERQEYKKAAQCLMESLVLWPQYTSIYIQLALLYVLQKDWAKAMHWVKLAGNVEIPKTTLVINPKDYKAMILESLFHIYLNTGRLDECLKVAHDLSDMVPTDLNKQRFRDMSDIKNKNDIAHHVVKLAYHLKQTNQTEQLKALINSIPREIAEEPALVSLRNDMIPPRDWEKDEISIFCGPGWEKWSPKNTSRGIGGSEEAVIYLTKELAKLGWRVIVYADPQEEAGVYDNVTYLPHYHINWKDNFNILVSWRQIGIADIPGLRAKKIYVWNHDIQNKFTYTKERVDKITKFMFLSKWHRENVPDLLEEKIFYTGNGINI